MVIKVPLLIIPGVRGASEGSIGSVFSHMHFISLPALMSSLLSAHIRLVCDVNGGFSAGRLGRQRQLEGQSSRKDPGAVAISSTCLVLCK